MRKVVSILLLLCLCLGSFTLAFAAGDFENADEATKVVYFNDGNISVSNILKSMNAQKGYSGSDTVSIGKATFDSSGRLYVDTKGKNYLLLQLSEGQVKVYPSGFKDAKSSDVSSAMKLFTDAVTDCSKDSAVTQELFNSIQESDPAVAPIMLSLIFDGTKGDLYKAYTIISPIIGVVNIILGIAAIAVLLLLLLSTGMDLVYMGFPVLREGMNNRAQEGGGGNGKGRPFGVSHEAYSCVLEVEKTFGSNEGYKNIYVMYFKRRVLTYIVVPICLLYLVCGGLSGIIGGLLTLVSGFGV